MSEHEGKGLLVSEIVKRLRQGVDPDDIPETEAAMDAAADYIERLRAGRGDIPKDRRDRTMTKQPDNLPDGWEYDEPTNCVICGGCAFRYGAEHSDSDGKWTCPNCGDGNDTHGDKVP